MVGTLVSLNGLKSGFYWGTFASSTTAESYFPKVSSRCISSVISIIIYKLARLEPMVSFMFYPSKVMVESLLCREPSLSPLWTELSLRCTSKELLFSSDPTPRIPRSLLLLYQESSKTRSCVLLLPLVKESFPDFGEIFLLYSFCCATFSWSSLCLRRPGLFGAVTSSTFSSSSSSYGFPITAATPEGTRSCLTIFGTRAS